MTSKMLKRAELTLVHGMLKSNQKIILELQDGMLRGYKLSKDSTQGKLLFSLNFALYKVSVIHEQATPDEFIIEPYTSKKKFRVRAPSQDEAV